MLCSAATKDRRLTHGINLDCRKTFLVINVLRLIRPEIILKEFNLTTCKETEEVPEAGRMKPSHTSEGRQTQGTTPMPTFLTMPQCRWNYRRATWSDSKDSKYRNCNSTTALLHNHFWFRRYDSKIKRLPVLVFHRNQCFGSKKWRQLILWTS